MRLRKFGLGLVSALALAASMGMAHAKSDIVVAMQLEPPHLDPTGAAAGAIDSVLYSNVFEGLTRFGPDGSVNPGLARLTLARSLPRSLASARITLDLPVPGGPYSR